MARKEQNNVEYFPFLCKEGISMYFIENKYGNDGYATWIKILRELAVTNYHYLNLSDKKRFMYLSSKCKIDDNKLTEIIEDLCSLGEFNIDLWNQNKIIFSEKFIDNIKDAYKRRNNKCIDLLGLCKHLVSINVISVYINSINDNINTHSIVEYSKVNNSKVENSNTVFFDEFLKLNYTIDNGEKIYGNLHQRLLGGLSEKAIKEHCINNGIDYEK